jgi:uncharacterized protein
LMFLWASPTLMETSGPSRRQVLLAMGGLLAWPTTNAGESISTLTAAWQHQDEQHVGLITLNDQAWSVQRAVTVPTRAHGMLNEVSGHVVAVARRPGEWLLRWHPDSGHTQWHWMDEDRRLNGHVIASADARVLWTTETDLESASGLLGVRDARTLEKTAEWPTHGLDPHQLLALPTAAGSLPAGTLMVANGGIPTLPETGRGKRHMDRMDSSLVAMHPVTGELLGQWRLGDPFLSIRHLAWDASSGTLGIALQAEHPDKKARAEAPVLAIWNSHHLQTAIGQPALAGYGGDICAWPGGGFAVSCPRAGRLALFDHHAIWRTAPAHHGAYALASDARRWCLASDEVVATLYTGTAKTSHLLNAPAAPGSHRQLDNHWLLSSAPSSPS